MSSFTVRNIDFRKFLDEGIIVDASEKTKWAVKCYIFTSLPDKEVIDIAALVKQEEGIKEFNKEHRVILDLPDQATKIRKIENSGAYTYWMVKTGFSMPSGGIEIDVSDQEIYYVFDGYGNTVTGSNRIDWLFGGAGDDIFDGKDGIDFLHGGNGNDTLTGGKGHDLLEGGNGNDTLDGGDGEDWLIGGAGDDLIYDGTGEFDALSGGPGNNTYCYKADTLGYYDLIKCDAGSKGVDTIDFRNEKRYFLIKPNFSSKIPHLNIYLADKASDDGSTLIIKESNHFIQVQGLSKDRKLLIKNYDAPAAELIPYIVKCKAKDTIKHMLQDPEKIRSFEILLPKGSKEIFVLDDYDFIGLYKPGSSTPVEGVVLRTCVDKSGFFNSLFVQ